MDAMAASAEPDPLLFEATLKPHRSLSRRGIIIVIAGMLSGSLVVTSLMALLGAWPVAGFNGADLLLAVFLFRLNIRAARAVEVITLSRSALIVTMTDQHGRRASTTLAPYWLKAVPRLVLAGRGQKVEIARSLGEEEKRDLAEALVRALHRWRNPRFDNPQLK